MLQYNYFFSTDLLMYVLSDGFIDNICHFTSWNTPWVWGFCHTFKIRLQALSCSKSTGNFLISYLIKGSFCLCLSVVDGWQIYCMQRSENLIPDRWSQIRMYPRFRYWIFCYFSLNRRIHIFPRFSTFVGDLKPLIIQIQSLCRV